MTQGKPADPNHATTRRRLNSWKEIANHLGVAVRTVQRWEASEELPVRRHRHAKISSAYAYVDELERWWDSRPAGGRRAGAGTASAERTGDRRPPSIVVLPFANLDREQETEVLSDGLTEDLITALSRLSSLQVVARSSAFYFKGKAQDVREIAARLGVGHVLEGSVRRAGKRLRVTAQLVSAKDGCHLWAQRFDREMEDPFDLQDQLTQAITEGLRVHLPGAGSVRRPTRDVETYNAFLRGRFFWNQRTPTALRRALACFEEVIERDPDFAPAHAGVAECHVFQWVYAGASRSEAIPQAEAAASRASSIDPSLSEVNTAVGLVRTVTFDLAGADAAFQKALESNPGDHRARHWRAMALASLGRCEEAGVEIARALELDPFGVTVNLDVGRILYLERRYDEAIVRLRHTLEIGPDTRWARIYLALASIQVGADDDALAAAAAEPALAAFVRARLGDADAAREALEAQRQGERSFAWEAVLHLGLGQDEQALAALATAAKRFEADFLALCPRPQPLFDRLRSHPAFEALLPR